MKNYWWHWIKKNWIGLTAQPNDNRLSVLVVGSSTLFEEQLLQLESIVQFNQMDAINAKKRVEEGILDDVIAINYNLDDVSSLDFVEWLRGEKRASVPLIIFTESDFDGLTYSLLKDQLAIDFVIELPISLSNLKRVFASIRLEKRWDGLVSESPLSQHFNHTFSKKIQRLERILQAHNQLEYEFFLKKLRAEIRRIADSSYSYGWKKISQLSNEMGLLLMHHSAVYAKTRQKESQLQNQITHYMRQLKFEFQLVEDQNIGDLNIQPPRLQTSEQPPRFLLVDEDDDMTFLLEHVLHAFHLSVLSTYDALLLDEMILIADPDYIFLSIDLEDENTLDVLHSIKQLSQRHRLIAMVSSEEEAHFLQKIYPEEFLFYLVKPFLVKDLVNVISKTLARE